MTRIEAIIERTKSCEEPIFSPEERQADRLVADRTPGNKRPTLDPSTIVGSIL
jgi:hypothetical protein